WNGSTWIPSSTGTYNIVPSTSECRFSCIENHVWNGTQCVEGRIAVCTAKPANTEWNDGDKNGTYIQTWNGSSWQPEIVTTYNTTEGDCQYVCLIGYYWEDNLCRELQWSLKAPSEKTWSQAISYCNNLVESGHSDWRLPTISELRTLIQNCPATETSGECTVTDECLYYSSCRHTACDGCSPSGSDGRYSKLGDTEWFWSSSTQPDISTNAWYVLFRDGKVSFHPKANSLSGMRCVR
ncbi:MAG TPA: DUF1566 domain-containing protein, partial [bacterium]|nr:DUF1566 domain-containing protein [bacterium]